MINAPEQLITDFNLNLLTEKLADVLKFNFTWTACIKESYNGEEYLYIESEDFRALAGIMAPVYKKLVLRTFNSKLYEKGSKDYETYGRCWMTLSFSYDYVGGGSNSCEYLEVRLDQYGEWQVNFSRIDFK